MRNITINFKQGCYPFVFKPVFEIKTGQCVIYIVQFVYISIA